MKTINNLKTILRLCVGCIVVYVVIIASELDTLEFQGQSNSKEKEVDADAPATKKLKVFQVMNIYDINKDNYGKTEDDSIVHHQPFDQWVTIQSIERAKQHMPPELEMTVVCAILRSDWDILSEKRVTICDHRVLLERSTLTEYGGRPKQISFSGFGNNNNTKEKNEDKKQAQMSQFISELFSKREFPFMQDIIDAVISVAKESSTPNNNKNTNKNDDRNSNNNTYIMLTNADIGFSEFFTNTSIRNCNKDVLPSQSTA